MAARLNPLIEKLNPQKLGYSPKMTALVGAILGHDYGVRDRKGGYISHLSITSDGFILARSTASDGGGAFLGDVQDLCDNLRELIVDAGLTDQEKLEFWTLWKSNVTDWRSR